MTPTPLRVSIAAVVGAIVLLAVIFELIRSRRLQERYALLWLLTGVVILVLAAWRLSPCDCRGSGTSWPTATTESPMLASRCSARSRASKALILSGAR